VSIKNVIVVSLSRRNSSRERGLEERGDVCGVDCTSRVSPCNDSPPLSPASEQNLCCRGGSHFPCERLGDTFYCAARIRTGSTHASRAAPACGGYVSILILNIIFANRHLQVIPQIFYSTSRCQSLFWRRVSSCLYSCHGQNVGKREQGSRVVV